MFIPHNIITNIDSVLTYRSNLVICSGKEGIALYEEDALVTLSSISSDYACVINDYVLFQQENGGPVYYRRLDDRRSATGTIDGSFFLFDYQVDSKRCYLPTAEQLFEFDEHLQLTGSYQMASLPNGIWDRKQYHMFPHVSCFSLQDNTLIWDLENDEQLIKKITFRDKYFSIRNGIVILRSPFMNNTNYLTGLDANTGAVIWQHKDYIPDMTFIEEDIYSCYYQTKPPLQGRLLVIDCKTGGILIDLDLTEELSRHSFRTADHYHLTKRGSLLYIAATYAKSVHALNIDTARIEWSHKVDTTAEWLTSITVTDNNLFVTDQQNMLHIFKRS